MGATTEQVDDARLLERAHHLSRLDDALTAVRVESRGRVQVVGGEAGVGKTVLAREFRNRHRRSARILWGACDPLFTPRPLGPFLDIAETLGDEFEATIAAARPHHVATALLNELRARDPTVLVIEDAHWADEATLDVLRLLSRRIDSAPALLLVTYRDDELAPEHPLRIVLGELTTHPLVSRLKLDPLSPTAVTTLAEPHAVDPAELYRKTGGNPFFVTEVLAAADAEIPATVRDAVLARTARLSHAARRLVETVAIVPQHAELWLIEALAAEALDPLDECIASGVLTSLPEGVAFRHELARLAVEETVAPHRRLMLHRRALDALVERRSPDLARLAHHAEAAGDAEAVLRFAPAAAQRAASVGAHREAAAQYARALRFAGDVPVATLSELFERRSYACYLTGDFTEAIEAELRALECHRRLGEVRKQGDSLRSLSRLLRYVGRIDEAVEKGHEAVRVLEQVAAGHELALAYAHMSHMFVWAEDAEEARTWGNRALELARELDDVETHVYSLINLGSADAQQGKLDARKMFEQSLELATHAGLEEHAGRAHVNLVWWAPRDRSYAVADQYLRAGLDYCTEHGLDLWRLYLLAYRARSELNAGRWDDAVESASLVLRDPRSAHVPRIWALAVIGLIRARRGDPDVWAPLEEAWALAEPTAELQRIEPAAAARAEAFWLEGRLEAVGTAVEGALRLAVRRRAPWIIGELASWQWRAGRAERDFPGAAEPYALQIAGDWQGAAAHWRKLGCPYEAALALGDAEDEDALQRALDELRQLGATAPAAIVARRLRERGAQVARGPRATTKANPANLTAREVEVLGLVAKGLRNSEIAARLFLSPKTVDHHVSAILRKLDVRTRGEASAEAVRLGLAGKDG